MPMYLPGNIGAVGPAVDIMPPSDGLANSPRDCCILAKYLGSIVTFFSIFRPGWMLVPSGGYHAAELADAGSR